MCVLAAFRSLFSKHGKQDRRDTLKKTIPRIDTPDGPDPTEALWKDGLIDEGLLSLLEDDDGVGLGEEYSVDVI